MTDSCKILMIFPLFNSGSFWNYREACELTGARYPAAPLGLITVAALLPESWDVRLINRNTELLTEEDFSLGGYGDDRGNAAAEKRCPAYHRDMPGQG